MNELNAVLTIAYRDFVKLLRDPVRLVSTFIFPLFFITILGGSMQANLGRAVGYNLLVFTFTGVLAQTLFQSSASGIISLIDDRENDFSQEIFVSPISRYSIVLGKILGESLVALPQGIAIMIFALVAGVPFSLVGMLKLLPVAVVICLFGGAFGLLVLSNLKSQRSANQVFPFIMLPQYFLAGVFAPIKVLPFYLDILAKLTPMRYAVDFTRDIYYAGNPDYSKVILEGLPTNSLALGAMFTVFLVVGTLLFVRGERNR